MFDMSTTFGVLLLLFLVIILIGIFVFWIHQLNYSFRTDRIVFLPTSLSKIKKPLIQIITKYVPNTTNYSLIELGCGTGHILKFLDRNFEWAQVVGVELDQITYWMAKINLFRTKIQTVKENILDYKIPAESVIYCYLGQHIMGQLYAGNQFSGHLIISLDFSIPDINPTETILLGGFGLQKRIHIYDFRSN
jgi:SAM-dependent methyltransferase